MNITSATATGRGILFRPALGLRHCHCSRCRNLLGNLVAQGAVIRQSQIKSGGESNLRTCRSSPGFVDCFCRTWGCRLFSYEDSDEDSLDYAVPGSWTTGPSTNGYAVARFTGRFDSVQVPCFAFSRYGGHVARTPGYRHQVMGIYCENVESDQPVSDARIKEMIGKIKTRVF
ncbi:MAG: GFA family protein [Aestuariivirga sp.]